MASDNDKIPEVSVGVEMTEKGFSASAKSRAIAAFDRLIGEMLDVPSISIGAFNKRRQARADVRAAMIRRASEQAIRKIETDETTIDLVVNRMIADEFRKQENKERVAELALEDLREDPPTEEDGFNEEEFTDWMNVFSRYAEDASSERLRQLWAKVLAGQIRKDRAFSFGTLRLLSELDPAVAASFQDALEYTIEKRLLVSPGELKGDELFRWAALEDAGFISSYVGIGCDLYVGDDGNFVYEHGGYVVYGKGPPSMKIRVSTKKLTQAGLEVASILPDSNRLKALEAIAKQKSVINALTELFIGQVVGRQGSAFNITRIKIIKTSS